MFKGAIYLKILLKDKYLTNSLLLPTVANCLQQIKMKLHDFCFIPPPIDVALLLRPTP